jgi:phosphoglycerol transferase MdoB-like AlkP superfamily enzyme
MMNTFHEEESDRKKTWRWLRIATIAYLIVFHFLFMLALASSMVFDRPNTSIFCGFGLIFIYFLMPLSIPCTLYLVWSRYARNYYAKSRRFCLIPIWVIGAVLLSFAIMDVVEGLFK